MSTHASSMSDDHRHRGFAPGRSAAMQHSPRIDPTAGSSIRKTPPGPCGHWLLGSMPNFLNDSLGYLRRLAQDYGDVVRYRVAHMTWYQVNHPDGIARILQENNRNYGKGALTLGILRPVAGNGLFLSEGEFWLRQRRLMQPSFHHRHVATFGAMMVDATQGLLNRWEVHAAGGWPIDIMQAMSGLTLEIASRALFSTPAG